MLESLGPAVRVVKSLSSLASVQSVDVFEVSSAKAGLRAQEEALLSDG